MFQYILSDNSVINGEAKWKAHYRFWLPYYFVTSNPSDKIMRMPRSYSRSVHLSRQSYKWYLTTAVQCYELLYTYQLACGVQAVPTNCGGGRFVHILKILWGMNTPYIAEPPEAATTRYISLLTCPTPPPPNNFLPRVQAKLGHPAHLPTQTRLSTAAPMINTHYRMVLRGRQVNLKIGRC